ncbi:MAG: DUF87 domain-containing protein [Chthoniobacteraceae bacterium]
MINGPAVSPHIALMGRSRSGKTTTGMQMAIDLVEKARIPLLIIDPKGEFVADGEVQGKLRDSIEKVNQRGCLRQTPRSRTGTDSLLATGNMTMPDTEPAISQEEERVSFENWADDGCHGFIGQKYVLTLATPVATRSARSRGDFPC